MGFSSSLLISSAVSFDTLAIGHQNKNAFPLFLNAFIIGLFQASFFAIGLFFGKPILKNIQAIDHWVVLIGLSYFGLSSLFSAEKEKASKTHFITLACLVSIDALTVGFSLAESEIKAVLIFLLIIAISFFLYLLSHQLTANCLKKSKRIINYVSSGLIILLGVLIFTEHMLDHGI